MFATISHSLFDGGIPIIEKILRTLAVYFAILALLRLSGKRELAQLNSFDLVVLLLLSNVVQNAIIGPDNSLTGGLIGATTLIVINAVVIRVVRRQERVDEIFEGHPTSLITNGEIDIHQLKRMGMRRGDLLNAVRRQGATSLASVEDATLYPGGAIVVRLTSQAEPATKSDIARLEAKLDQLKNQ